MKYFLRQLFDIRILNDAFSKSNIGLPKHLLLVLELRQYKNNSIQSKRIPILKLPGNVPHRIGGEKARQFQSWHYF